jgi:Mitochondrial calcium uniporter
MNNEVIVKGLQQTLSYYRAIANNWSNLKVSDLEHLIEERQQQLIVLNEKKKICDKKANFRARDLLAMGSTIFFAQFAFIMLGTFVTHSWDVMEPISYVMMLGNFTVGMFFYAYFKEEMQLTTL